MRSGNQDIRFRSWREGRAKAAHARYSYEQTLQIAKKRFSRDHENRLTSFSYPLQFEPCPGYARARARRDRSVITFGELAPRKIQSLQQVFRRCLRFLPRPGKPSSVFITFPLTMISTVSTAATLTRSICHIRQPAATVSPRVLPSMENSRAGPVVTKPAPWRTCSTAASNPLAFVGCAQ